MRLFSYILFPVCFSTVSSILGAWLDQYSEDFWTPPNYECLHQLLAYLHLHFLGSDLERRARNLLAHFHRRQQCEPDPDGMKAGQERDTRAGRDSFNIPEWWSHSNKNWSVRINQCTFQVALNVQFQFKRCDFCCCKEQRKCWLRKSAGAALTLSSGGVSCVKNIYFYSL